MFLHFGCEAGEEELKRIGGWFGGVERLMVIVVDFLVRDQWGGIAVGMHCLGWLSEVG